jgi:hypothetical protein
MFRGRMESTLTDSNGMRHHFLTTTILAAIAAAPPAIAQTIDLAPAALTDQQVFRDLHGILRDHETFDAAAPFALTMFRQNDLDGVPGLSDRDRELHDLRWLAELRATELRKWLAHDLDGDLSVTAEELRVSLWDRGWRLIRQGRIELQPTPEQAAQIVAEDVAAELRQDLDGDGAISYEETRALVDEIVADAATRVPHARMAPSALYDFDGDGIVSEDEFLVLARAWFDTADSDGDGTISTTEYVENYPGRRAREPLTIQTNPGSFVTMAPCPFDRPDEALPTYVIGGYEGAALTDLYMGETPEPTELVDVVIPPEGQDLRLVAAFRDATFLRIDDPGGRLRTVWYTRGPVGLVGDTEARLVATDPACHVELWDNPPRAAGTAGIHFERVLGHSPVTVLADYTLGTVDLSLPRTIREGFLPGARPLDILGPAGALRRHALFFNPGGYVPLDPASVTADRPVRRHAVAPQWVGLADLVEAGTLEILPRGGERRGASERNGRVTIGGRTFEPGGGDDLIVVDGFHYTEERPGSWVGRRPLHLLVRGPFTFPAGLSGAHTVTFVLPEGIPMPSGDPGGSTVTREGDG